MNRREFLATLAAAGVAVSLPAFTSSSWKYCSETAEHATVSAWVSGEQVSGVAIWNCRLTKKEVAQLGAGTSPLQVRVQSLTHYFPFEGEHE